MFSGVEKSSVSAQAKRRRYSRTPTTPTQSNIAAEGSGTDLTTVAVSARSNLKVALMSALPGMPNVAFVKRDAEQASLAEGERQGILPQNVSEVLPPPAGTCDPLRRALECRTHEIEVDRNRIRDQIIEIERRFFRTELEQLLRGRVAHLVQIEWIRRLQDVVGIQHQTRIGRVHVDIVGIEREGARFQNGGGEPGGTERDEEQKLFHRRYLKPHNFSDCEPEQLPRRG